MHARSTFHLLILLPLLAHAVGCGGSARTPAVAAPARCVGPADIRTVEDIQLWGACPAIDGDLRINGAVLAGLDGLERIVSVRYLVISGNPQLSSIAGLSGLRRADGITVTGNASLTSLHGLEGVRRLEGLVLFGNGLTSLDGLQNLESIMDEPVVLPESTLPVADVDAIYRRVSAAHTQTAGLR